MLPRLRAAGLRGAYLVDHPALRNERTDALCSARTASYSTEAIAFDAWTDTPGPDEAACFVATSDFGGLALMREWNEFCVVNRKTFFPVVLQDHVAYIGPLVIPGQSPCFECGWARQNANLNDPTLIRATEPLAFFGRHVAGALAGMIGIAAEYAAMELLKYLSQVLPGGNIGKLIEVDLLQPSLCTRKILRAPFCPVCSSLNQKPTPAADHEVFMPGNATAERQGG
jgi:bacteriocin biosynthesis cyclodehydratase domain-containing protein